MNLRGGDVSEDVRALNPDVFGQADAPAQPMQGQAEQIFAYLFAQVSDFELIPEYLFHPVRRWRFDFAHPQTKIAVEIDGGVWTQGRHTRGAGYMEDCRKLNEAALLGWRVFRFPAHLLTVGDAEMVAGAIQEASHNTG